MAFWSYAPLVEFFRRDLTLSAVQLALIPIVLEGAGLSLAPLAGWWVDRANPTVVARVILSSAVLGMLIAGGSGLFAGVLLGFSFLGMSFVAVGPMTNRMLASSAPLHRLGTAYSIKQSSVTIGMLLGAILLPPIAVHTNWRVALIFAAVLTAGAGILIVWRLRDSKPPVIVRQNRAKAFRDFRMSLVASFRSPAMRSLFAIGFVFQGITYSYMTFIVPFAIDSDGLQLSQAVILLGAIQSAAIATRPALGWLSDVWVAKDRTKYLILLAVAVGLLMISSSLALPVLLHITLLVCGGAVALAWIGIYFARLAELSAGSGLGFATGVSLIPIKLGGMIIPFAMGVIIDRYSYRHAFFGAGVALVACSGYWWWHLIRGVDSTLPSRGEKVR